MSEISTLITYLKTRIEAAKHEDGVIAIEYVILAAAIIAAVTAAVAFLATDLGNRFAGLL